MTGVGIQLTVGYHQLVRLKIDADFIRINITINPEIDVLRLNVDVTDTGGKTTVLEQYREIAKDTKVYKGSVDNFPMPERWIAMSTDQWRLGESPLNILGY